MLTELSQIHKWSGLKTLVEIESTREFNSKIENEKRYYILSLDARRQRYAYGQSGHIGL